MKKSMMCGLVFLFVVGVVGIFLADETMAQTRAALVQDVENPARTPFYGTAIINLTAGGLGGSFGTQVATVPVGKRVVLEYAAVFCQTNPADSITEVSLSIPVSNNSSTGVPIPVFMQGNPVGSVQHWVGGGPVKIYAEYSQYFPIGFGFARSSNAASAYCYVKLFGYTFNVQ